MEKKKALITGITGQDGSYLAEFLLKKGYEVHGIVRRTSTFNRERIEHLTKKDKFFESSEGLILHYGDLTDSSSIKKIMKDVMPDEIYNLGAQSHVGISFEIPENTSDVVALGSLRLLDAMREICPKSRFYQASSSEMFGKVAEIPQSEKTPFHPRSPYGCSKVYSYYITMNYREAYGLHASNGILFNHESERRGENFVTRKITRTLAQIKLGLVDHLFLGNLDAKRDWGHAEDAVEAMWLILQQNEPGDYVIGTGETHSVREFLEEAAKILGINIKSNGKNGKEEEYIDENGKAIVKIDSEYFRPAEVDYLCADPTKAQTKLGWKPKTKFKELVRRMAEYDLKLAQKEAYLCGKENDVGEKISSAIKPLLEFADKYGIKISKRDEGCS
ncbi:GDP-mannose 4,6-dehydratase [Candidatus Pacearchaeota archaeon RBG_19FT_COMBO_34_9]|nr:MAG: GDP-mannose 4,6-dehydratase [Candidatus Pacearchaeota archaeon RBG_19FT_COMBO_34_9]OGJ16233.1 MAG: GDP-mannose 4,6-dehydratase [Candidatus Pacearchaeota archaeon RBG_13_33_26]